MQLLEGQLRVTLLLAIEDQMAAANIIGHSIHHFYELADGIVGAHSQDRRVTLQVQVAHACIINGRNIDATHVHLDGLAQIVLLNMHLGNVFRVFLVLGLERLTRVRLLLLVKLAQLHKLLDVGRVEHLVELEGLLDLVIKVLHLEASWIVELVHVFNEHIFLAELRIITVIALEAARRFLGVATVQVDERHHSVVHRVAPHEFGLDSSSILATFGRCINLIRLFVHFIIFINFPLFLTLLIIIILS